MEVIETSVRMEGVFPVAMMERLKKSKVIAGFSVENEEQAVHLAKALLAGGVDVIELALRSDADVAAVEAICFCVPEMLVGVGTILTPEQAVAAKEAGAAFGMAPGYNARVVQAAKEAGLPFAPGIATPSELEGAISQGCRFVKFFPAEAAGGLRYLKSISAPYAHLGIKYFPLGGINTQDIFLDYLVRHDVPAVGGSWIVKKELVAAGDWDAITQRAKDAKDAIA